MNELVEALKRETGVYDDELMKCYLEHYCGKDFCSIRDKGNVWCEDSQECKRIREQEAYLVTSSEKYKKLREKLVQN